MTCVIRLVAFVAIFATYSSCDVAGVLGKSESNRNSSDDGTLSETFFPSSAGGSLSAPSGTEIDGAVLDIPAGSLAIDTNISMGAGVSIANDSVTSQLDLGENEISSAGPAVVIDSDKPVSADNPFTLELPLSGAGLALANACSTHLVVVYQQKRVDKDGNSTQYLGVIPGSDVEEAGGKAKVKIKHFGLYQAACAKEEIKQEVSAVSTSPIIQKVAALTHVGLWEKKCSEEREGSGGENSHNDSNSTSLLDHDNNNENNDGGGDGPLDNIDTNSARWDEVVAELNISDAYMQNYDSLAHSDEESNRILFGIGKKRFMFKDLFYFGSNCDLPLQAVTIIGDYTLGDKINDEFTRKLDVTFRRITIQPLNPVFAAAYRYLNVCGKSDWLPGTASDFSFDSCPELFGSGDGDDGDDPFGQIGQVTKTIIQIKDGMLRLGSEKGEKNDEGREIEVDDEEVFDRLQ